MSSAARNDQGQNERKPVTITRLAEMKEAGEPITMITAYDFPSAQVVEEVGVDVVLVGDSAANCVLGYDSTVPVGMDEMTRLNAFKPFFTTKGDRGTGLGLVIVDQIVSRAGGRVQIESEVGRGTVIKVFLPRIAAAAH